MGPVLGTSAPLTVDHLLSLRAEQIPDAPLIAYPSRGSEYRKYTARQLNAFAYQAAKRYSKFLPLRTSSSSPERVVAIVGASNFDYVVSILGLSKLGMTILLLSTRISDDAYRHLIEKTGCSHVLVQGAFEETISRVREGFPGQLNIFPMAESSSGPGVVPQREKFLSAKDTGLDMRFNPVEERDKRAWIIHSSGSTGLPKPVGQTHRAVLNSAAMSAGQKMEGLTTLPLFHTYGIASVIGGLISGKTVSIYNADLPITGANVTEALGKIEPEILYSVPYTLKLVAETQEGIDALKKCKQVQFGGSSCPDELGDKLIQEGVKLQGCYGSSECGTVMSSGRGLDWKYLRPFPKALPYVRWSKSSDGHYELVLSKGWPSKVFTNRPDGSYATRDLFQRHPTDPGKWKYIGRLDDTIVLSNGEKANPVSIENSVRDNPHVLQVVCVGVQREFLGLIIIPSERAATMGRKEIIKEIWPVVEGGNARAPAYARILEEMIEFLPFRTRYPATDKGTVIRSAFYKLFEAEIDAMYARFGENNTAEGIELSEEGTKAFIRSTIVEAMRLEDPSALKDDTDFFSLGLDSLGSIQVRGAIVRKLDTRKPIGQNIVFEKPTVERLAGYLYRLRAGGSADERPGVEVMKGLVEKYSHFQRHAPGGSEMEGEYVVVTGASGSLGAHIVSQLVVRDSVRRVYCLIRAKSPDHARERTIQSLRARRVYDSLPQEALAKIVSFPSDFSQEDLGLNPNVYGELLNKVNTVIHAAWQVNFNMDVSSFEKAHIRGSHNLITFCLKSRRSRPASFNFCSSISTVLNSISPCILETLPSYQHAMPMGYAQSKLVTEKLCSIAARETGMTTRILRIGQVSGDETHGIWNATEVIPLTIQSARIIHALPSPVNDEKVSWLPVNNAAAAIIDLSYIPAEAADNDAVVFHVSHPKLLSWNNGVLSAVRKAGLEFETVKPTEWVRRLRESSQDPAVNPPVKLLGFFERKYACDEVRNAPYMDTCKACKFSPALREAKELDAELLGRFVEYWRDEGWER